MVKTKLALILDSFFISSLIGLVSFLWLRKFIKNAIWVNFFSILIILLSFIVILLILLKSNNKKIFKNNNEKFLKQCINFLIVSDKKTYSTFLCKLLNCNEIFENMFKLEDNFLYINIKSTMTAKDFFDAQELFFKHKTDNSKLYFIYRNKDKDFDELLSLSPFNFSILSFEILTKVMTQKNIYPIENNQPAIKQKRNYLKQFLKSKTTAITKSQFKHIFVTSLSLLFLSFIVPFSNYYLIVGTILLIISIISLFRKDIVTSSDDSDFLLK